MTPRYAGDGWELYVGDCLAVLPGLTVISAVVSDPPYGIALSDNSQGGRHGRSRPAWANHIIGDDNQEVGLACLRWCEEQCLPTAVFASPRRPWPGEWRSHLVWDKGPAVGGGGDVTRCWKQSWELIQVARNGPLRCGRDASVITHWVTPQLSAAHPAAKPVPVMEYLIAQLTDEDDTVLDPFAGSASTGVACIKTNRRFIGIEIDPHYAAIAAKRLERAEADKRNSLPFPEPEPRPVQSKMWEAV